MPYTIVYRKRGRADQRDHWPGIFTEAKACAERAIALGLFDEVEIENERGELVFKRPPTLNRS